MSLSNEMKKGFTLVELLVVIALMGMMGTLAVSSYSAITRGMNERAALDAAKSLVDAAVQRSNLDRTKIHIYFFDEVLKLESATDRGVGSGVAIAVRPVGRISMVPETDLYCDEFTDIEQIYGALEVKASGSSGGGAGGLGANEAAENAAEDEVSSMRIYNMSNPGSSGYVSVQEGVVPYEITDYDLEDVVREDGSEQPRTWTIYGFKKTKGEGSGTFKVGDAYGQEFAVTRLPPGYFFGNKVKMSAVDDLGQHYVDCREIDPTDRQTPSMNVYVRRPNGQYDSIGDIAQVKDGD